ncbi:MAG: hypothetical protein ACOYB7_00070 [Mycobacterium sp.]|jgi:hypothetical protein
MWSANAVRKVAFIAGATALLSSGALVACSKEKPAETPPSTSAPLSSTEKVNIGSFSPTVKARPAPTALPGNVITGN